MEYNERVEKIIQFIKAYGAITNNEAQSLTNSHRNTITNDFKKMVDAKILVCSGVGKGSIYQLLEELIFSNDGIDKIFSKKEKKSLENYFKVKDRKKVFFNKIFQRALDADFSFPKDTNDNFKRMRERVKEKKEEFSEKLKKKKREKLVIDLSWASSSIEGSTYSLLETESLIKYNETAKGKKFSEAQMILNHKDAIEHIRQGASCNKHNVLELHQILTNNLDVNTGFREHLVTITNSSFVPCDNKFEIISFFDLLLEKINEIKSVLEKSVAANLLLAFLQPFSDGNKRTSRLFGNAILLSNEYLPISFSSTAREDYIKAILYFYEKQEPSFFKQLFLNEMNRSFREYIG